MVIVASRRGRERIGIGACTTGRRRQIRFHGNIQRIRCTWRQGTGIRVAIAIGIGDLHCASRIPEAVSGARGESAARSIHAQFKHIVAVTVVGDGVLEVHHGTAGGAGNIEHVIIGGIGRDFGIVRIHGIGLTDNGRYRVRSDRGIRRVITIQVALGGKGVLDLGTCSSSRIKADGIHHRHGSVHAQAGIGQLNTGNTGFTAGAIAVQVYTRRLINRGQSCRRVHGGRIRRDILVRTGIVFVGVTIGGQQTIHRGDIHEGGIGRHRIVDIYRGCRTATVVFHRQGVGNGVGSQINGRRLGGYQHSIGGHCHLVAVGIVTVCAVNTVRIIGASIAVGADILYQASVIGVEAAIAPGRTHQQGAIDGGARCSSGWNRYGQDQLDLVTSINAHRRGGAFTGIRLTIAVGVDKHLIAARCTGTIQSVQGEGIGGITGVFQSVAEVNGFTRRTGFVAVIFQRTRIDFCNGHYRFIGLCGVAVAVGIFIGNGCLVLDVRPCVSQRPRLPCGKQ